MTDSEPVRIRLHERRQFQQHRGAMVAELERVYNDFLSAKDFKTRRAARERFTELLKALHRSSTEHSQSELVPRPRVRGAGGSSA